MAAFTPDTLRTTIANRGGLATTEKFEISFTSLPPALDANVNRELSFLCENVALPTKSLSATEKFIHGVAYQLPYRQAFQELSMTFLLTSDMSQKKFFDTWQAEVINPETGNMGFYEDYSCRMTIRKFDRTAFGFGDASDYDITLFNVWPSIVAEVQLTHGGGNEIARLPVTMQYKMWKSGIVTGNVNGRSTGPPSQGRTGQGL
tara:strand:+ start:66 stop:677 length:612 start_codon:yes stop_codon:yes gene_type:complete